MAETALETLRREIDEIDDAMHDLLMRRTRLVTRLSHSKGEGLALRPAREAQVLRRLLKRHSGPFPRPVLMRIWREIFSAFNRLQGPFRIGVHMPEAAAGYLDLARDQYGSYSEARVYRSHGQVLRAVSDGAVTVGVLALPREGDEDPWWPSLMSADATTPRIVARLPFSGKRDDFGNKLEALAVAGAVLETTGDDRTYIAFAAGDEMSRTRMRAAFKAAGLDPTAITARLPDAKARTALFLVELAGFIEPSDRRLERFRADAGQSVAEIFVLGGYAVPLADADLRDEPPQPDERRAERKRK
ncbi:MAG: chorismate mutase [Proteobacteria bacterium]|nr:chorismate mutase [Pseudomonadota bacterium]